MRRDLDYLFNPSSVALIGASDKPGSLGRGLAENVLSTYSGKIYFVNRRGGKILGLEAYRSVSDISDSIDLALVIIPAQAVPETLEELGEKRTRIAVVYSGGFREAGREDLEKEVLRIAERRGIRILGPNCVGFIDNWTPINATFVSRERQGLPRRGYVSLISQSGALGSLFLDLMSLRRIGLRRFVSVGNASDIKISEILDYLANDENTKVIGLYIESVSEGRSLVDAVRRVSPKKPVVILRGGRTTRGSRAALSHVAALSASPRLVDGVLSISGVTRANSIREFLSSLEALERIERTGSINRIIAVTNTGGMGVLLSDALEINSINLEELGEELVKRLREVVPPYMSINNPIDLSGDAPTERFRQVINVLINSSSRPDLLILINQPQTFAMDTENFLVLVRELREKYSDLRILLLVSGGVFAQEFASRLRELGVVVGEDPEEIVSMIRALRGVYVHSPRIIDLVESKRDLAKRIIERALKSSRSILFEYEVKELLSLYSVKIPRGFVARSREEIKDLFNTANLRFPVVAKIVSHKITHKSSVGGVVLGIRDLGELERIYAELVEKMRVLGIDLEGVLIEEMIRGDLEFFVGGYRHEIFGPLVSFGSGGVFVEVLRDVSFRTHDSTVEEIYSMISETMFYKLLSRYDPAARKRIIDNITRVVGVISRVLYDFEEIREIEINPATISNEEVIALDARAILVSREI